MERHDVEALVKQLDTKDSLAQEAAWNELRPLQEAVVPYLLDAYHRTKKWQGRVALVFHSTRFARNSEAAFKLGILACQDKSTLVRYRACGLLAYSLRMEAIPDLEALLQHSDAKTAEDAAAAIDAIRTGNHHFFIDRRHTGQVFWRVNDEDTQS